MEFNNTINSTTQYNYFISRKMIKSLIINVTIQVLHPPKCIKSLESCLNLSYLHQSSLVSYSPASIIAHSIIIQRASLLTQSLSSEHHCSLNHYPASIIAHSITIQRAPLFTQSLSRKHVSSPLFNSSKRVIPTDINTKKIKSK